MNSPQGLPELLRDIRACTQCMPHLDLGPNPVLAAHQDATIMLVGQAPGTRVHATGIPWNDPSGDKLRQWLGVDKESFYNPQHFAILPMGFCYPGKGKSGDLPPKKLCAELWRDKLHAQLPNIKMTLLVGQYAQKYYLGAEAKDNLTKTVAAWQEYAPTYMVMPHPSPRNRFWLTKNPWFETDIVPFVQKNIRNLLK